jgi:hypothetical protein
MFGSNDRLEQKLQERGAQAQAVLRSAEKTTDIAMRDGQTWFVWKLGLRVRPLGEPEFDAQLRQRYRSGRTPTVGSTVSVLFDPDNHSKVCIDSRFTDVETPGAEIPQPDAGIALNARPVAERTAAPLGGSIGVSDATAGASETNAPAGEASAAASAAGTTASASPASLLELANRLRTERLTLTEQLKTIRDLAAQAGDLTARVGAARDRALILGADGQLPHAQSHAQGPGAGQAQVRQSHAAAAERIAHLTRLADLHEQGALTDAEFEKLKRKILSS